MTLKHHLSHIGDTRQVTRLTKLRVSELAWRALSELSERRAGQLTLSLVTTLSVLRLPLMGLTGFFVLVYTLGNLFVPKILEKPRIVPVIVFFPSQNFLGKPG